MTSASQKPGNVKMVYSRHVRCMCNSITKAYVLSLFFLPPTVSEELSQSQPSDETGDDETGLGGETTAKVTGVHIAQCYL